MDQFQQYLVEEFLDDFRERRMSRRAMLRRITLILGGAAAAATWLQSQGLPVSAHEAAAATRMLIPSEQTGVTVSPDDPAISAAAGEFPARDGAQLLGYLVKPNVMGTPSRGAGVLVIHANSGLQPHYQDIARRFAKEGYVALAVDLVSREGGTQSFADQAAATAALSAAGAERHVVDMSSGIDYLESQAEVVPGGVGAIGYCFGGSLTWRIAVEDARVAAAAPYYGSAPPLQKVPQMRAAAFGIYADNDERVNATKPGLEDALLSAGKTFEMKIYPGTLHGFFNETSQSYAAHAAPEAWADTLAWFRTYLPTA